MRRIAGALIALLLPVLTGCAQNPFAKSSSNSTESAAVAQQQAATSQVTKDLQARAVALDKDNQELESLLAQNRQQTRLLEDQLSALRDQLTSTTTQLTQTKQDKATSDQKAQAIMASTSKAKPSATITANNSLHDKLSSLTLPGVEVREDGDVVRIELPADKLFDFGTNRLRAGSNVLIDGVASEIGRAYPDQIVGIEGYTNSAPVAAGQLTSNLQLSVQQASVVYDQLVQRGRLRPDQLFVVGQGANHPIVSNATAAGQARNRRIELVVYPEKRGP